MWATRDFTGCSQNKLEQITLDHSLLQELVDRGFYSQEEAAKLNEQKLCDPGARRRTHGGCRNPGNRMPCPGDVYLLCSDGLSRYG